jgi:hypothetical protein
MELAAARFPGFPSTVQDSVRYHTVLLVALIDILALVLIHSLYWLIAGLNQPIADLHQFRQTQTAITAYWIWRGGPLLAYETPVLGSPWSIPFEFPVYQYLLAAMRLIGIPFEAGGRLLSFAFYLGLLWPLKVLFRNLGLGLIDYLILTILLLSAPIYVYWSRTVMMESCALFFAAAWLAFLVQFLRTHSSKDAWIAISFGILAVLTKLTTFAAFGLLGGIAFVHAAVVAFRGGLTRSSDRMLVWAVLAGILPIFSGVAWVFYSDHLKLANLLGSQLTSQALAGWNFGSIEQRFSSRFWLGAMSNRMLPDIFGFSLIPALIAGGAALGSRKYAWLLGLAILGFFTPLLIFTNLHFEHNYYQYANALFLLAVAGFGLAKLAESGRAALSTVLLVVIVAGQLIYFNANFARVIAADYSGSRQVAVGSLAKQLTTPDASLLIIGDDWNSAIPYHAERRALAIPYTAQSESINKILAAPQGYLADAPLGAIIYCPDQVGNYPSNQAEIRQFVSGRKSLGAAAGCQILTPYRQP